MDQVALENKFWNALCVDPDGTIVDYDAREIPVFFEETADPERFKQLENWLKERNNGQLSLLPDCESALPPEPQQQPSRLQRGI